MPKDINKDDLLYFFALAKDLRYKKNSLNRSRNEKINYLHSISISYPSIWVAS